LGRAAATAGVVACVGAAACSSSAGGGPAPDGQALVSEKCTRCHVIARIDAAKHDRAGWETTVSRMRDHGLIITDAEYLAIVNYLSTR
jgi:hypothetical protein